MGNGAEQNVGPDGDGRRRNDQTPSTDNSAGMAGNRETPAVASTIGGLMATCIDTIASFPWAKGQEQRIKACIEEALKKCIDHRATHILRSTQIGEPITQEDRDALKPHLLLQSPIYMEHVVATDAAKDLAIKLVHEQYSKLIKELDQWVREQIESVANELGQSGGISAAELCEKLKAHFPPPVGSASGLTPEYLCLEMSCYKQSEHVYGKFKDLRGDTTAIEQATHKKLSISELLLTADALATILGSPIRQESTTQEIEAKFAIEGAAPWRKAA